MKKKSTPKSARRIDPPKHRNPKPTPLLQQTNVNDALLPIVACIRAAIDSAKLKKGTNVSVQISARYIAPNGTKHTIMSAGEVNPVQEILGLGI